MAGVARFACEGMAGCYIAVLRLRAQSGCGQNRSESHPARD